MANLSIPSRIAIGDRFTRLTVIADAGRRKHDGRLWLCRCDCGNEKVLVASKLLTQRTRSCGCLNRDVQRKRLLRHGASQGGKLTPEYVAWQGMIQRTSDPKARNYHLYGGRGITVCKQWRDSFEQFLADMGPKPTPKHSLGRMNNDDGYTKQNTRWETPLQQANNTRTNRYLTYQGQTQTMAEWARSLGVSYREFLALLKKAKGSLAGVWRTRAG